VGRGLVCALALTLLGVAWIYDPEMPSGDVACIDDCATACGLQPGLPRPLDLVEVVKMRRYLAGLPTVP
jgi:hypothetical protein